MVAPANLSPTNPNAIDPKYGALMDQIRGKDALTAGEINDAASFVNELVVSASYEVGPIGATFDAVSVNTVAILDSYGEACTAAEGANMLERRAVRKRLESIKDTAAKGVALDRVLHSDPANDGIDPDQHGIQDPTALGSPVPPKRHPTLSEIYNKKKREQYRALAIYRDTIEGKRAVENVGGTPRYIKLEEIKTAFDIYGAVSGASEAGAPTGTRAKDKITEEVDRTNNGGSNSVLTYDNLTILEKGKATNILSDTRLEEVDAVRASFTDAQAKRITAGIGRREQNKAEVTAKGNDYKQKLAEVEAEIDAALGTGASDQEKSALKALVNNKLAIRDGVEQLDRVGAISRLANIGNKVHNLSFEVKGKRIPYGKIILLGAGAIAVVGVGAATAASGGLFGVATAIVVPSIVGGAKLARTTMASALSVSEHYNTLQLPEIRPDMNADGVIQTNVQRVEAADKAINTTLAIGAVALFLGAAGGDAAHYFLTDHVTAAVNGHNSTSGPHPSPSPTVSVSSSPGTGHPMPSPSSYIDKPTNPPTIGPPEITSTPPVGPGNIPAVATTPKIPDITSAINSLNAHGDTAVRPGQGFDTLAPSLASHTPGLEGVHFTGEQLNAIQSEAGKQLVNVHYPDGTPVAYEMSPGQYGLTLDGNHQLPGAATKAILKAMELHAGSTAGTHTAEVFSGSATDVAHSIVTNGDANISTGEGFNAATASITDHIASVHGFDLPPDQVNSIASDAAKNIYDQGIKFPDGRPVAYIIQSGQYAGEYGIGGTGQLPESAVQIIVRTAEQHAAAIANTNGVNLNTLSEFMKAKNITSFTELVKHLHLPASATRYGNGEGLTTLLSAYSKIGFTLNTNYSLSAIAAQINSAQTHGPILALKGGKWIFTPSHGGKLSSMQIGQILQQIGFGQQDLTLAS